MATNKTSRHWVLDAVELIGQLQALNSHYEEILEAMGDDEEKLKFIENKIEENNNMRRDLMEEIAGAGKDHWRCITKHVIFSYTLATELSYAGIDSIAPILIKDSLRKQMYSVLSIFLGEELIDCGRCLNDALLINDEIEDRSTLDPNSI